MLSNISDTNKNILNQLTDTLYNNRHIQKKLQIINKYQQITSYRLAAANTIISLSVIPK